MARIMKKLKIINHVSVLCLTFNLFVLQMAQAQVPTEIEGDIKIGYETINNPEIGTIRWNPGNSEFEGFTTQGWVSLTDINSQFPYFGADKNPISEFDKLPIPIIENAMLGTSVAMGDGFTIVGSYLADGERGAAHIFMRVDGIWSNVSTIEASDRDGGDQFGRSVAINGRYAIVGAPGNDDSGANSGSAYIFKRSGSLNSWSQQQKLTASNASGGDSFGWAVDIHNSEAVVTANLKNSLQGSAYVYSRTGTSWSEDQILTASNGQPGDRFGWSADLKDQLVVIGAITADSIRGTAYVFQKDTSWFEQEQLLSPDGQAQDRFGRSVSVSNAVICVGAYKNDENGLNTGAVYTYFYDGANWNMEQKIMPNNVYNNVEYFGWSISQSEDYLVVGANLEDLLGVDSGAGYIYKLHNQSWNLVRKLKPSDGQLDDNFGWSVSINGGFIVIGSPLHNSGLDESGAVYFY